MLTKTTADQLIRRLSEELESYVDDEEAAAWPSSSSAAELADP